MIPPRLIKIHPERPEPSAVQSAVNCLKKKRCDCLSHRDGIRAGWRRCQRAGGSENPTDKETEYAISLSHSGGESEGGRNIYGWIHQRSCGKIDGSFLAGASHANPAGISRGAEMAPWRWDIGGDSLVFIRGLPGIAHSFWRPIDIHQCQSCRFETGPVIGRSSRLFW